MHAYTAPWEAIEAQLVPQAIEALSIPPVVDLVALVEAQARTVADAFDQTIAALLEDAERVAGLLP